MRGHFIDSSSNAIFGTKSTHKMTHDVYAIIQTPNEMKLNFSHGPLMI